MRNVSSGVVVVRQPPRSPVLGHVQLVAQQQSRVAALRLLRVQSKQLQVAAAALEALAAVNAVHHQEGVGPVQIALTVPGGVLGQRREAPVRDRGGQGEGLHLGYPMRPPTLRVFVYCFPAEPLSKGHLSADLAPCERRHCLVSLPPTTLPETLETLASGAQSQPSGRAPTETWLSLGTAGFGSGSWCSFGFRE